MRSTDYSRDCYISKHIVTYFAALYQDDKMMCSAHVHHSSSIRLGHSAVSITPHNCEPSSGHGCHTLMVKYFTVNNNNKNISILCQFKFKLGKYSFRASNPKYTR